VKASNQKVKSKKAINPNTGGQKDKGVARPTAAQRKYLVRGLEQAGGKLPIFDDLGQEVDARTIRACIKAGWVEPWFANPIKPDWLVCKLTPSGRIAVNAEN
jgi:hypothetical protein